MWVNQFGCVEATKLINVVRVQKGGQVMVPNAFSPSSFGAFGQGASGGQLGDGKSVPVLSPSFIYKRQGNFEQLDIGAYFLYHPIILGLWYRGIPLIKNVQGDLRQDASVVILGFQFDRVEIVYSYDITVSALGPISGGAHEVALKYRLGIDMNAKSKKGSDLFHVLPLIKTIRTKR